MATGCAACNHRCRHPSPAGHLAPAHRPPGGQDHGHQPAQRPAGGPLARRKAIFARLDSDIALEVLERDPTPQAAQRLGEARLAAFLGRHGYSGRRTPAQLLHRLPAARSPSTSSIPRSRVDCIRIQVRLLGSLLGSLTDLDRALAAARASIPRPRSSSRYPASARSTWPRSWPRSARSWTGPVTSPTPLPRLAPPRSPSSPARAPWSSPLGSQYRCPQCPGHLRRHSRHASRWAAHLYRQARQRGRRHPQAIRILMRAWLRVIWARWHTGRPYDITHHRAEQRLAQEPAA
jgi:hypothetical protein